ncbi:MAG: beta-galactosidase, partial [Lentisphaeria bacterium]|nr:beta-galactosidase [Lentisphaeria bacterium]
MAKITKVETHSPSLRLRIRSEEARKDVSLKLLLEDPSGKRSESILWKGDLKQGENVLEKVIPGNRTLLSGEYLCFLSLEEDQKTLDWYDTVFRHEGKAQILALETDKDVYGKNEAVRGTLLAKGPGTLLLYLRESATGRVISRLKMKAVTGKKIPFALKKVFASREKHFTLECRIFHKGVLHAERKKELLMRPERKREEKITPLLWGSHFMSWREKLYNKDFAQMGFKIFKSPIAYQKGIEDYRWEGYDVLQYGMEYAPLGIEHIRAKQWKDMPYTRRTPCLLSPSYRKNLRKKAEVVAGKMNQLLSDYCFVSDEISLGYSFERAHDYCFAPDCLKAFRAWMKKKYKGDLKALNRDWQRNYKSFSEILPDTVEQAQKRGNFVSNQEHRLFMMNHLTDSCKIIADTISQISGAQTGMSGMPLTTVYQGFDVLDTMPILKCSTLYVQPFTIDLMRSLMEKDHISGAYTDYRVRYQVWEQLIGGLRTPSIWWYGHLIRRGDGRASEEGILLSRMFRSIRDSGSSFILGHGKRTSSPVTLVWSTPSLTAASLVRENGKLFLHDPYNRNMNSISQLIRDLGMDMPNVIPDRDLIKVTARTHPVLILPGTIRLSENQVKALWCYVREGGVLIADLQPGVFNEFGVKRVANPLMKLFGIRSLGKRIEQRSSITLDNLIPRHMLWGNVLELEKGVHAFRNIQEVFHPIRAGSMTVSGSSKLLSKALVVNS